ncbi:MAG: hypothetical protein KDA87_00630 [Planctomycetales bacterium]|nr:hypothetical protein [Planctomycetales bacterium]
MLRHIGRYGMTNAELLFQAGVRGVADVKQAAFRLQALVRRGDLVAHRHREFDYYSLASEAQAKLTIQGYETIPPPRHARTLLEQYAALKFCCGMHPRKQRLMRSELERLGLQHLANGNPTKYYLKHDQGNFTLGAFLIDRCERGDWRRILRRIGKFAARLQNDAQQKTLQRFHFEITLLAVFPEKATRLAEACQVSRELRAMPYPLRCVAIPSLLPFIRPMPDPAFRPF